MTKSKLVEVAQSLGEVVGEVLSLVQRNEELQTEVLRLRGLLHRHHDVKVVQVWGEECSVCKKAEEATKALLR